MSKISNFAPFSEGEPPVIGLSLACRVNKPCKQGRKRKGKRLPDFPIQSAKAGKTYGILAQAIKFQQLKKKRK